MYNNIYKKILWATDIHLECVNSIQFNSFIKEAKIADYLILSGDISGGFKKNFELLANSLLDTMICFVLGNHDYYGKFIEEMNNITKNLCNKIHNLCWLSNVENGFFELNNIPILGHEGWYDCFFGKTGRVILNDFIIIKDFRKEYLTGIEKLMVDKFRELATISSVHFKNTLESVFKKYDKAILVTHIPPFSVSAKYNGKQCDDDWLPYMTSKLSGDVILDIMSNNLDKELIVLCGHTHEESESQILPNLKVLSAKSIIRFPKIYKDISELCCGKFNF